MNERAELRWFDLWNITFQGKLFPSEYKMMEHNLVHDPETRIKGLNDAEIEKAIKTLDKSGAWEKFTPRLKHLRAAIFASRNTGKEVLIEIINRAKEKLKAEKDPVMRWVICCESCNGTEIALIDQPEIIELLARLAAKLPGGINRDGQRFKREAEVMAHSVAVKFAVGDEIKKED